MLTEEELDEIYEEVKEKRKMCEAGIDFIDIRDCIKDILKQSALTSHGELVDYLCITINSKLPTPWICTSDKDMNKVFKRDFGNFSLKEQEYFMNLLGKYFVIEELEKYKFKLTLLN